MSAAPEPTAQVLSAVRQAARGADLAIRAEPDLRGASVAGTRVLAYVVPTRKGTFRVELWYTAVPRCDAFKTVPADELAEAATIAVDHALNRPRATAH